MQESRVANAFSELIVFWLLWLYGENILGENMKYSEGKIFCEVGCGRKILGDRDKACATGVSPPHSWKYELSSLLL